MKHTVTFSTSSDKEPTEVTRVARAHANDGQESALFWNGYISPLRAAFVEDASLGRYEKRTKRKMEQYTHSMTLFLDSSERPMFAWAKTGDTSSISSINVSREKTER
jgi:hypothetical protein